MNKYSKVICPFCHQNIPFKYKITEVPYTGRKRRKKKRKPKIKKEIIGIDFEQHRQTCKKYKEFINK